MAKVKIQGHASGTGVLTVTAPNTSTDRTITLPDFTGTLLTSTVRTATNEEDAILIEQSDGTDIGSLRINNGSFLLKGKHSTAPVQIQTHDGNEDIEVDPDGFIKFETGGSERMRLTDNGLTFNGDTAAANALDDYEEGTHQYTITGSTGGSMTPRSGYQYLSYTKIGRQVTVIGKFETSGTHNATGYLKWSLPFAIGNFTDQAENPAGSIFIYRTGLANVYNPTLVSWSGASYFAVYYNNISNNEVTTLDGGNVDSTIEGFVSFTYFTA